MGSCSRWSGFPEFLQPVASLLPATAFADVLRFSLDPGLGLFRAGEYPFVVLAAWAIGATALAVRAFRWH